MTDHIDSKESQVPNHDQPEANAESVHRIKSPNPALRRPFLGKVLGAVRQAANEIFARNEKVPLEEINEHTVARVINKYIGNNLQESVNDDRYANPFDIVSVIIQLGYLAPSSFADYVKKFPDEYQATRKALFQLHRQGILDIKDYERANAHGEQTFYKVVDRDLLTQIAQGAEKPLAK